MKKTFLLSAALLAVLAAPALAQDRGNDDRRGSRPPAAAPAPAPQAQRGPTPKVAPPAQRGPAPAPQRAANPPPNRGNNNRPDFNRSNDNRGNNGRDFGRNDNNRGQPGNNAARPNVSNNARPGFNGNANSRPAFNGNAARRNPSYAQYNRAFNAPQRFRYRGPAYRPPAGFYYRRWSYGDFLPGLFWASNYWINDFGYYELMPPPPGTVWVRYGSDALLIDRYTGEIIQVEYNVFY